MPKKKPAKKAAKKKAKKPARRTLACVVVACCLFSGCISTSEIDPKTGHPDTPQKFDDKGNPNFGPRR